MLTTDDLEQIKKILDDRIGPLTKDLKDVKKRVRKIEKTTDVMIKFFNKEDLMLQKRVEKQVGISSSN